MIKKYNKLIRDRIPEKIKAKGETCKFHIAGNDEYWDKLKQKLSEEIDEFREHPSIEELADIQEVVYAIADFKFDGISNLEKIRVEKFKKRGGFGRRLVLDETGSR